MFRTGRWLCVLGAALAAPGLAAPPPGDESDPPVTNVQLLKEGAPKCAERRKLRFYEPLYGLIKFTEGDETAGRLHFSFKYTLSDPECISPTESTEQRYEARTSRDEWFISYTGEFDFYMASRESGPVINRINNPAFHFRRYFRSDKVKWLDVGVEHRSTGQTTDPNDESSAQAAFDAGNHEYFDTLSQDTNFVSLETRYDLATSLRLWARWKVFYFANEVAVTWGPNKGAEVEDYDRFRFIAAYKVGAIGSNLRDQRWIYAEWTVGDKGFKTDSLDLSLYFPAPVFGWKIPFYVRAHFGPNDILSDFTKERNSIGFGLQLLE